MIITEETMLKDIMAEYPWLIGEAQKLDDRFKLLDSPIARMLLKKATVADASKRTGFPAELIIEKIQEMVAAHESA